MDKTHKSEKPGTVCYKPAEERVWMDNSNDHHAGEVFTRPAELVVSGNLSPEQTKMSQDVFSEHVHDLYGKPVNYSVLKNAAPLVEGRCKPDMGSGLGIPIDQEGAKIVEQHIDGRKPSNNGPNM